ncbi:MAG: translocation/assembly module TamB, partial [Flavobacteriia bacterium]
PNEGKKIEDKKEEIVFEELKGLTIKFNLQVTKDALAQVVIDKRTGSLLKGYSEGNLQLNIDTNGKFEMFGELVIDRGEYLFKNIVSKYFIVKKGSTIIWNGSPFDAELNIIAVNHTKANPAVILDELKGTRKIDIDLITNITGTLSEAKFDFDIEIPNSSSMVASELDFKLNNEDDKLTQFFSLLATGSFVNLDQNNINFNGNAAIAGTIAEKSSKILSEMLKSSHEDIQVGVTYEAGVQNKVKNVNTDDQLGILVSGRIGNKITVNGKVGVPVGANTSSSVVGEVEVILPLNEPETLQAKVYNHQNEIQFDVVESEGYTQGVGISYLFQFDNTKEFLEKIGLKKTEAEKNMTKEQRDSVKLAKKKLRKLRKEDKKEEKKKQ